VSFQSWIAPSTRRHDIVVKKKKKLFTQHFGPESDHFGKLKFSLRLPPLALRSCRAVGSAHQSFASPGAVDWPRTLRRDARRRETDRRPVTRVAGDARSLAVLGASEVPEVALESLDFGESGRIFRTLMRFSTIFRRHFQIGRRNRRGTFGARLCTKTRRFVPMGPIAAKLGNCRAKRWGLTRAKNGPNSPSHTSEIRSSFGAQGHSAKIRFQLCEAGKNSRRRARAFRFSAKVGWIL